MVFQPGQSGNPKGYNGGRRKGTRAALIAVRDAGYIDPLLNLAKIQHESPDESTRASAAASLLPYVHPKLQAIPTPRFIETPIEVPEFTSVEVAERFLGQITSLLASGKLDLDFADSLTKSTTAWISSQYAKQGIDLKAQAQGASDRDVTIKIEGGLSSLPGTNITMPNLENGTNGYELLPRDRLINDPHNPPPSEVDATANEPPPPRECSVEGCDTVLYAKGLCRKHYARNQRTGTLDRTWDRALDTADHVAHEAEPLAEDTDDSVYADTDTHTADDLATDTFPHDLCEGPSPAEYIADAHPPDVVHPAPPPAMEPAQ